MCPPFLRKVIMAKKSLAIGILLCFLISIPAWPAKKITTLNWAASINNSDSKAEPQVQVIENPAKPPARKSARVVELKPVLSIVDQPENFFFKYPSNIKLSRNGYIFVLDREQILHFDSSGKFLRNYFKKGQGPGEMQMVRDIIIDGENLVAFDIYPRKVCRFDFNGNLLSEIKISELQIGGSLVHIDGSRYYFVRSGFPDTGGKWLRVDNPNYLQVYDAKTNKLEELAAFPVSTWAIAQGGSRGRADTTLFRAIPYKKNQFIISHTEDYLLKIFDVEKKQVVATFRRKYKRVKIPEKKEPLAWIGIGGQRYSYNPAYFNDILEVLVVGDLIWALTSTVDKSKGLLVDVFNQEGKYVDCFYLKFPFEVKPNSSTLGIGLAIDPEGQSLWATVKNPDETFSIKKFQLD